MQISNPVLRLILTNLFWDNYETRYNNLYKSFSHDEVRYRMQIIAVRGECI